MVKYPNNKQNASLSLTSATNRGISLENDINSSNNYYLSNGLAVIHKKPTPIQIVQVDYPHRRAAKITEAYFKLASTTDYNGIYRHRYIDFEAKQCAHKTKFVLANFHLHQIHHLESVLKHGAIAFVLICFTAYNEVYLVDAQYIIEKYKEKNTKSISYEAIKQDGHLVNQSYIPRLDYLKIVDDIYFGVEENKHEQ